jgi:2'-5' RNA ligase
VPRDNVGVVIAVPEPFAGTLASWRELVGDPEARRVPPHVTLLPPTLVRSDRLGAAERHLARVAADGEPFEMHLSGTGTFRPVSDVVFVVVAAGIAHCEQLERRVRSGPLARAVRFPYHPHVTVAADVPTEQLDAAYAGLTGFEARFTVKGFTLFRLGSDGVWRPRREFLLGTG